MKPLALSLTLAIFSGSSALASEFDAAMTAYLEDHIAAWVSDPVIIGAIEAQNAENSGFDQTQVDALETQWSAQVGTSDAPLVDAVLGHAAADFLRDQVAMSGGSITEVFIMDAHGLNVAASHATSDIWQGDEAKFLETYAKGAGAVHLGDIEFDESSQTYQGQISMTIVDSSGAPIGAVTVGVDAEALL